LPSRGWDVTLGLTQGDRFNDVARYVEVQGSDLPIRSIDGRQGSRSSRIRALRRAIREESPDIVLSMRVFDVYEAVGLEKAAGGHAPRLAVGIRGFESPYLADLVLYRDSVDLCVTSGELIAAAAVSHCGMEASRVVSIGGGVHPPLVPPATRTPRQPIRLLYAGRIASEQKRILDPPPFLDELERQGIAYSLDIAGTGPEEADLREQLAARERAGTVVFHGWVSRDELYRRFFPGADCFLHFAGWEGVTIAPREAMAHGVVPVITRFPGHLLEGQFRDGETALTFEIGDIAAAASSLRRLVEEPGLLARLSEGARASQAGRYSFEGSMNAWADAFDRCLALPLKRGALPEVRSRTNGRLARLGLPDAVQDFLRSVSGRKQRHESPGSEWPTSSGMMSKESDLALRKFAEDLESTSRRRGSDTGSAR